MEDAEKSNRHEENFNEAHDEALRGETRMILEFADEVQERRGLYRSDIVDATNSSIPSRIRTGSANNVNSNVIGVHSMRKNARVPVTVSVQAAKNQQTELIDSSSISDPVSLQAPDEETPDRGMFEETLSAGAEGAKVLGMYFAVPCVCFALVASIGLLTLSSLMLGKFGFRSSEFTVFGTAGILTGLLLLLSSLFFCGLALKVGGQRSYENHMAERRMKEARRKQQEELEKIQYSSDESSENHSPKSTKNDEANTKRVASGSDLPPQHHPHIYIPLQAIQIE